MNFAAILDTLAANLGTDTALNDFCLAQWGKPFAAKKGYKKRHEIGMDELPVARLTQPRLRKAAVATRVAFQPHVTMRVYAGFLCEDVEQAADLAIQLGDLLGAVAVTTASALGLVAEEIDCVTDEGQLLPSCFLVMDITLRGVPVAA